MAQHVMAKALKQLVAKAPAGARAFSYAEKVGKREVVGYGVNGLPVYVDRVDYPMPAIRFKEDTPEILVSIILIYQAIDIVIYCIYWGTPKLSGGIIL